MSRRRATQALILEGFLSRLSFGLLTFALPLYGRELGMSLIEVGMLTSFAVLVSLLLKPLVGGLADRFGLRRSLTASLVLRSLLCIGYVLTTVPWQLFAVRGAHGAADSLRDPSVHALIAENGGRSSMASTFAWYQTAKTSAGSIGKSLAGVLLATAGGFTLTFGVTFALSLLPVVAVLTLVPRDTHRTGAVPDLVPTRTATLDQTSGRSSGRHRNGAEPTTRKRFGRSARREPGIPSFSGLGFAVAGTSSMLTALFPILATEYAGLSTAEAGLLYLVTPVVALTGPLWGRLSDRVSRALVLSVRGVANVLSAMIFLFFPTLPGMWVGKSMDDLGKAAFRPAWGSLMAEVSGRDRARRARAMSYMTAGEDAGDLAGPVIAGVIWSGWGVPALLVVRALVACAAEVYAFGLEHRRRSSGQGQERHEAGVGPEPVPVPSPDAGR